MFQTTREAIHKRETQEYTSHILHYRWLAKAAVKLNKDIIIKSTVIQAINTVTVVYLLQSVKKKNPKNIYIYSVLAKKKLLYIGQKNAQRPN